jgi:hypothetical protein
MHLPEFPAQHAKSNIINNFFLNLFTLYYNINTLITNLYDSEQLTDIHKVKMERLLK